MGQQQYSSETWLATSDLPLSRELAWGRLSTASAALPQTPTASLAAKSPAVHSILVEILAIRKQRLAKDKAASAAENLMRIENPQGLNRA